MERDEFFTKEERELLFSLYEKLLRLTGETLQKGNCRKLKEHLIDSTQNNAMQRDSSSLNPVIKDMQTAVIVAEEIGMKRASILGIMLHAPVRHHSYTVEYIQQEYDEDVAGIIRGLIKINDLYDKSPTIESESFRNLLLSFAEDMHVILAMIVDRVNVMRQIKDAENDEARRRAANGAAYLYAPLAHRLGLYRPESELEDLSLRYTEHDIYYHIKEKLNETKRSCDRYIANFTAPIQRKLEETGLHFRMKGRTKSVRSIYQKVKKQKCQFENVYDLFAVRIILESQFEKEKQECWQAYPIVTDIYQPSPKRLRDWLSVPKSNGYESLRITVMGPKGKRVEVQIRTECTDEIAERGLAAHWRYKGVKGESGLDEWLTSIREALENTENDLGMMDQFKLDLYEDEVFVFTPRGGLFKLAKGATVLDFTFHIHSKLECKCIGTEVSGKNVQLRQKLNSGDQVEIMTSNAWTPKRDWLNIVTTSKAHTKIHQALKEMAARQHDFTRETLERKFKNRKMEYDEVVMMHLVKRLGFKNVTEFYQSIVNEVLDVNDILDKYIEQQKRDGERDEVIYRSAEEYNLQNQIDETTVTKEDVLVIDQNLKGLDFKLAKCCSPIHRDDVFGLVTVSGGIKIHRNDYPSAGQMHERFGYRIVRARWARKLEGTQYPITLRVVGHDDIGTVTNITSIISRENGISLHSVGIDSNDGLFSSMLTIMVGDAGRLEALIKKLRTMKGVKQVSRN